MAKPEWYRRNVAIGITAVMSIFIFTAWVVMTRNSLQEAMRESEPKELTPVEEFKKTLPSLQDDRYKTQLMQQQPPTNAIEEEPDEIPGTAPLEDLPMR